MSASTDASLNRISDRFDILEARMAALEIAVASGMTVVADVPAPRFEFNCAHLHLNVLGQCLDCGDFVETD